jgi:hypothetical protein
MLLALLLFARSMTGPFDARGTMLLRTEAWHPALGYKSTAPFGAKKDSCAVVLRATATTTAKTWAGRPLYSWAGRPCYTWARCPCHTRAGRPCHAGKMPMLLYSIDGRSLVERWKLNVGSWKFAVSSETRPYGRDFQIIGKANVQRSTSNAQLPTFNGQQGGLSIISH